MKPIRWQGFAKGDRVGMINRIKDIILRSEGYLINHQIYSDLAISFSIEIEASYVTDLRRDLESIMTMEGEKTTRETETCLVSLSVSFADGSGRLKHTIANVPG